MTTTRLNADADAVYSGFLALLQRAVVVAKHDIEHGRKQRRRDAYEFLLALLGWEDVTH